MSKNDENGSVHPQLLRVLSALPFGDGSHPIEEIPGVDGDGSHYVKLRNTDTNKHVGFYVLQKRWHNNESGFLRCADQVTQARNELIKVMMHH